MEGILNEKTKTVSEIAGYQSKLEEVNRGNK